MTTEGAASAHSARLIRALSEHPEHLADVIQTLHSEVADADDLVELLGKVARTAVRLLGGVDWASVTVFFDGKARTVAATDDFLRIVDATQHFSEGSTAPVALYTDAAVARDLERLRSQWPLLASAGPANGILSMLAIPLHVRAQPVASLNLYSGSVTTPTLDPHIRTVLTEYAVRALASFYGRERQLSPEGALRRALRDQAVIYQAVGILMQRHGFGARYASDVLIDQAEDWHRNLSDQARHIISQHTARN